MNSIKRTGQFFTLCLLASLMVGCLQGNAIQLTYDPMDTPSACPGKAVVYKFKDQRATTDMLGKDDDGKPIMAKNDVADWVGWALFDELMAAGSDAKYRTTTVQDDATIVTGEILEVAINQTGKTTFKARVALNVRVQKNGQDVHVEKFISEVEDVAVPGYGSQADILASALQGALDLALPAICSNL